MKRKPSRVLMWLLVALLCFSVVSMPIFAADRAPSRLDAVSGARSGVYALLGARRSVAHDIYVSEGSGGQASVSTTSCVQGRTVSVQVSPDSGYSSASIVVITASGIDLEVCGTGGLYSFSMPGEPVVVDVEFQYNKL